jgi:ribosome maturation factor RimP
VGVDDCAETSRTLNPLLDVEDLIPGSYDLEVSSPGLDRNLRKPQHFTGAIGQSIHVTTVAPMSEWNGSDLYFEKRRNITAILQEFDGTTLTLLADNREVKIPYEAITRAYINFELKTTPKKGKKV